MQFIAALSLVACLCADIRRSRAHQTASATRRDVSAITMTYGGTSQLRESSFTEFAFRIVTWNIRSYGGIGQYCDDSPVT